MHKLSAIAILAICVLSCTHKKPVAEPLGSSIASEGSMVYHQPLDSFPTSNLDSVAWLPLESSDINALKEISKLCIVDNRVIIGDKRQGIVHTYDINSGKLLYIIADKGNGPEDYLETATFTITPTSIYTLDNFSHAISRYSIDNGSFIEKKTIPFVAWDMEAYDDESFLFTWLNNNPQASRPSSNPNCAVWQTDSNFNIVETYLPIEDDYVESYGKQRYFTWHSNNIIFHALKYDGYFSFAKNNQPEFHPIEFSNPRPKDKPLRLDDINYTSWQYLGETPFISDDLAVVDITEGDTGQQMFATRNKVFGNSTTRARNIPINVIGVTDDGRFIGYINDSYDQYQQLTQYGFQKGSPEVDNMLKNGGCCLIFYSMHPSND